MPTTIDPFRAVAWSEPGRTTREIRTGGWRTRRPVYVEATAPCRAACPAGEPIAHWIELARAGDYAGAWALIREENPFPAITGRVCAHPCESACNRGAHDAAVAIDALERFVGDWGLAHATPARRAVTRQQKVAVVGGGPAGLACAYHLARFGYGVSVFEAAKSLGGILRSGIPEYRLPRTVLEREIELVVALGITVRTSERVDAGRWSALADHDAVFIAIGAAHPVALTVPGTGAAGVGDGLAFLAGVANGEPPAIGEHVLVVGGGSTAMDVARTARRTGARVVTIVALESRADMPAIADEVSQAAAEGVAIMNRVALRQVRARPDGSRVAVLGPAHLERAADGAIVPVHDDGPDVLLEVDTVLAAIGQRADLASLPSSLGVSDGVVAVDARGATSMPSIFAGGDVASRDRTVVRAIGAGTRAARAIHARFTGNVVASSRAARTWVTACPDHVVTPSEIRRSVFPPAPRATPVERDAGTRLGSFAEVVIGLDEAAASAETRRCFTCGHCVACDVCASVCPDMAITRVDGGVYQISPEHCKGCGLCAYECPRGALHMALETGA